MSFSSLPFLIKHPFIFPSILHLSIFKWLSAQSVGGTNHFNEPCFSSSIHF